jgi:mannose-1-phosphate guanylyltransferase
MKALILVGGEGTRLRPLTCNTPKAMVPVLNLPFLEHVIRHLLKHKIYDIVLAQGYLAQPIESYLGDGSRLGVRLSYIVEDTPLGTAGAIRYAQSHLDDTFLAMNGDIFTDLDITAMVGLHQERKAKVTIALTPVADPTAYGLIETDDRGRVLRFLEKPGWDEVTTNMINAGTYIIEPGILAQIPPERKVSIERETFPLLLSQGEPVYAFPSSSYWLDMGTPEKYHQLHRDLLGGKSSHYTPATGKDVLIGEHCAVHPTARIDGPVVIGDNCTVGANARLTGPAVIGPGCTVLEGTVIQDSLVWEDVKLGPRATVKTSLVAGHCCLNADSTIQDAVLGDNVTVSPGVKLKPGSKIWPGEIVGHT